MLQMARCQLFEILLDFEILVFLLLVHTKASNVDVLASEGVAESIRGTQIDHGPTFKNLDVTVDFR